MPVDSGLTVVRIRGPVYVGPMSRRQVAVLFFGLLVLVASWQVLSSRKSDAPTVRPTPPPSEGTSGVLLELPAAPASTLTPTPDPGDLASNESPGMNRVKGATHRIAVRLEGLTTKRADGVEGSLEFVGAHSRFAAERGAFDGKETYWFVVPARAVEHDPDDTLRIVIRAQDMLPYRHLFAWRDLTIDDSQAGTRTWRVTVTLRSGVHLQGRVLGPDGAPVADSTVEAYVVERGVPAQKHCARTTCRSDGFFSLRLPTDVALVVIGSAPVLAPASRRLEALPAEASLAPLTLTLRAGHTVRGRLRWEGQAPGEVWTLACMRRDGSFGGGYFDRRWCLHPTGAVCRATVSTKTDPEGRFEMTGLGAVSYSVRAQYRETDSPVDTAVLSAAAVPVVPPATGVLVDLRPAWFAFDVRAADGGAIDDLGIGMEREGGDEWTASLPETDQETHRTFRVPVLPNTSFTISVSSEGYETIRRDVAAPDVGESLPLTFELMRLPRGAPVTLQFTGGDVGPTHVSFEPLDENDEVLERVEPHRHTVMPDKGLFKTRVPEGRWLLTCYPGRSRLGSVPEPWNKVEAIIDVPAGGVSRSFPIQRGGLVRVRVRRENGTPLPAIVTLQDTTQAPVEVRWVTPYNRSWWPNAKNVLREGIGWTRDPLPPGRYNVMVSLEGFHTWHGSVLVERGKTTDVQAKLRQAN